MAEGISPTTHEAFRILSVKVFDLFEIQDNWPRRARVPEAPLSTFRVYQTFLPFIEGKPLPIGVNETQLKFFMITATLGLWKKLEEKDGGIVTALLTYYSTNKRQEDVGREDLGGVTGERVRQLMKDGFDILWEALPDKNPPEFPFPFDKHVDFPRDSLKGTGAIRAGEAGGRARRTVS